jgi:histidyl-tRNA synthetase
LELTTIKGFKDILPGEIETWQKLESAARMVFQAFGFSEIKTPLLEKTELFSRSIGQETDIVSKEMYSFPDSKGRSLSLRPEATASVVRAYIQHRLYLNNPVQKLFSIGPMFRHERPQQGRFRQFHQLNAELFGDPGPRSDAEIIIMGMFLLESAGLTDLTLKLNSLGCPECRPSFREELKAYLGERIESLCADCRRRAEINPLRVFDCKVDACKRVVEDAPAVRGFLCGGCHDHFSLLKEYLGRAEVGFTLDDRLVRGLDYYSRTTFEIQTERLGAQNAVAGGGRYDGLVKHLGGPDHPAIGFAVGMERAAALLEDKRGESGQGPELYIATLGEEAEKASFEWTVQLRKRGVHVEVEYDSKGLKAQMKRADRLKARRVLIVGPDELASGSGILRDMGAKEQGSVELARLIEFFEKNR